MTVFINKKTMLNPGIFALYFILFSAVFMPFAAHYSTTGNTDTLIHIALFNEWADKVISWFTGQEIFTAMALGEGGLTGYSEFYLGQTGLFHLGKAILPYGDAGGHAFLQVCLFSFNAFAMFFWLRTLSFDRYAAFLGGLFFSASSFMWGNHELLNTLALFPLPLSLAFLMRSVGDGPSANRDLILSLIIIATSYVWSGYTFVFGSLIYGVFYGFTTDVQYKKEVVLGVLLALVLTIPMMVKVYALAQNNVVNALDLTIASHQDFALQWSSLYTSPPGSILGLDSYQSGSKVLKMSYYAWSGLLFWALVICGLCSAPRRERIGYSIGAGLFFLLSLGPVLWSYGGYEVPSPFIFLYESEFLGKIIRIPGRFYAFSLMFLTVLAIFGVKAVLQTPFFMGHKVRYSILIGIGFLIANLPWINNRTYYALPSITEELSSIQMHLLPTDTVLFLPTSIGQYDKYHKGLSDFNREYQHVYSGQTLGCPMVNGSSSYYPKATKVLYDHIGLAKTPEALYEACSSQAVDVLVVNKGLSIHGDAEKIDVLCQDTTLFSPLYQGNDVQAYRLENNTPH
ncbi:MAG TPA: hypothetical protein DCF84_01735 [Bacteroidetes bacterium]|nr:hypothetical protein [Bacteroidota bacterium]|tara:strand:- start:81 stop:1787 length:1707 start_codon:yes stop_codon:yes gene_type:complete